MDFFVTLHNKVQITNNAAFINLVSLYRNTFYNV